MRAFGVAQTLDHLDDMPVRSCFLIDPGDRPLRAALRRRRGARHGRAAGRRPGTLSRPPGSNPTCNVRWRWRWWCWSGWCRPRASAARPQRTAHLHGIADLHGGVRAVRGVDDPLRRRFAFFQRDRLTKHCPAGQHMPIVQVRNATNSRGQHPWAVVVTRHVSVHRPAVSGRISRLRRDRPVADSAEYQTGRLPLPVVIGAAGQRHRDDPRPASDRATGFLHLLRERPRRRLPRCGRSSAPADPRHTAT